MMLVNLGSTYDIGSWQDCLTCNGGANVFLTLVIDPLQTQKSVYHTSLDLLRRAKSRLRQVFGTIICSPNQCHILPINGTPKRHNTIFISPRHRPLKPNLYTRNEMIDPVNQQLNVAKMAQCPPPPHLQTL